MPGCAISSRPIASDHPPEGFMRRPSLIALFGIAMSAGPAQGQTPLTDHLVGNLGGAVYATRGPADRPHEAPLVLPFAYLDDGRLFARVDTFGVKTVPIGAGYLELVGRISVEGSKTIRSGGHERQGIANPLPFGIGTFQETGIGGFFLYALHDVRSSGNLLEATYAAEFHFPGLTIYPQLGVEHRSGLYERHLRGLTAQQASAKGRLPYTPGATTTPVVALGADVPLFGPWLMNLQWRREWFGNTAHNSSRAGGSTQDSGFIALSYAFK